MTAPVPSPDTAGPETDPAGDCRDLEAGRPCLLCEHTSCGWCPECHPEVPEW
jgi:hypothetical protein